jgi:hypothetical protein
MASFWQGPDVSAVETLLTAGQCQDGILAMNAVTSIA